MDTVPIIRRNKVFIRRELNFANSFEGEFATERSIYCCFFDREWRIKCKIVKFNKKSTREVRVQER